MIFAVPQYRMDLLSLDLPGDKKREEKKKKSIHSLLWDPQFGSSPSIYDMPAKNPGVQNPALACSALLL